MSLLTPNHILVPAFALKAGDVVESAAKRLVVEQVEEEHAMVRLTFAGHEQGAACSSYRLLPVARPGSAFKLPEARRDEYGGFVFDGVVIHRGHESMAAGELARVLAEDGPALPAAQVRALAMVLAKVTPSAHERDEAVEADTLRVWRPEGGKRVYFSASRVCSPELAKKTGKGVRRSLVGTDYTISIGPRGGFRIGFGPNKMRGPRSLAYFGQPTIGGGAA